MQIKQRNVKLLHFDTGIAILTFFTCYLNHRHKYKYNEQIALEDYYVLCTERFDGGSKWSGNSEGKSLPFILILIKCIANANSSPSNMPSLSTSASFQILLRTVFGSFDLTISDFAAKTAKINCLVVFNE